MFISTRNLERLPRLYSSCVYSAPLCFINEQNSNRTNMNQLSHLYCKQHQNEAASPSKCCQCDVLKAGSFGPGVSAMAWSGTHLAAGSHPKQNEEKSTCYIYIYIYIPQDKMMYNYIHIYIYSKSQRKRQRNKLNHCVSGMLLFYAFLYFFWDAVSRTGYGRLALLTTKY